MNRRKFLKRGGLWLPGAMVAPTLLLPRKTRAQGILDLAGPANCCGGATCPSTPSEESDQPTESYRCGQTTDNRRTGLAAWDDGGTSRTICRLDFEITTITGDVSGKTFNAFIYTMSGANLDTLQRTSDNLTGVSATGWLRFDFSTTFTTTASVSYALIFGPSSADASNYVWVPTGSTAPTSTGYRDQFTDAGVANFGSGTDDQSIRIYWQ